MDLYTKMALRYLGESTEDIAKMSLPVEETKVEETEVITESKKEDPKAAVRNKKKCIFDNTNPKVLDNKDHFPISSVEKARSALARVNQFKTVPTWYKGSLQSLVNTVVKAVKKAYPEIEISDAASNPGKD